MTDREHSKNYDRSQAFVSVKAWYYSFPMSILQLNEFYECRQNLHLL